MATRVTRPLLGTDTNQRWLLRGAGAGLGAMILGVMVVLAFLGAMVGDASPGWGNRQTLVGVLSTAMWSLVAAAAGAVGAWQAAVGGAPHPAAARLAGALGPVCLIALVTLASFGIDGPGIVVALIQAVVEGGAAVVGATLLSRRLDAVW